MGTDGVVYDVPGREANERAFDHPSGGARGDGAFPQVRKISLVEVGTHVVVSRRFAPASKCRAARCCCGATFSSYEHWKELVSRGIRALSRHRPMASRPARRTRPRTTPASQQPQQPPRRQTQDVNVAQKTRSPLPSTAVAKFLLAFHCDGSLNGIVPNHPQRPWPMEPQLANPKPNHNLSPPRRIAAPRGRTPTEWGLRTIRAILDLER